MKKKKFYYEHILKLLVLMLIVKLNFWLEINLRHFSTLNKMT